VAGQADAQATRAPQPEVLAGECQYFGVHLAHLLASSRVLGGQRPRKSATAAADVQHPPGTGRAQHDPHPPHVVELEVGGVGQIDV